MSAQGDIKILADVPPEKREETNKILRSLYPEIMYGGQGHDTYPVVWDQHGILRWKTDPLISKLIDLQILDLNKLSVHVQLGHLSTFDYMLLLRQSGYSLSGYFDQPIVQAWVESLEEGNEAEPDEVDGKEDIIQGCDDDHDVDSHGEEGADCDSDCGVSCSVKRAHTPEAEEAELKKQKM